MIKVRIWEWPVGPQRQREGGRGWRGQEWLSRFSRKQQWILSGGSLRKNFVFRDHFKLDSEGTIWMGVSFDWSTNWLRDHLTGEPIDWEPIDYGTPVLQKTWVNSFKWGSLQNYEVFKEEVKCQNQLRILWKRELAPQITSIIIDHWFLTQMFVRS